MSLASSACRLLLTSFLASVVRAERPTEGGEQLALDVSGQLSVSREFSVASRDDLSNDAINDRDTALSQVKAALENAASKEVELREAIYHAVESEAALEQRTLDTSTLPKVEPEALNSTQFGSLAELSAPRRHPGHGHHGGHGRGYTPGRSPSTPADPTGPLEPCPKGRLSATLGIPNADQRSSYYDPMGTLKDDPRFPPGKKLDPRWADCRSMCSRLFLTTEPTGACDSVKNEFTGVDDGTCHGWTCQGWTAPEDDTKNGKKRTAAVFRRVEDDDTGLRAAVFGSWVQRQATTIDTVYETLKDNVYTQEDAISYANLLRTAMKERKTDLKNFENTMLKIDMGITLMMACLDAIEALKNDNVGFSQKVIASLDEVQEKVRTTSFKFDAMDKKGIPSLEAYKREIRAKMHLSGALVRAQKALDNTDDELDKAYGNLKEALDPDEKKAGVLYEMRDKGTDHDQLYTRMIRDGQDMADEMEKKLQNAFAMLCQAAWQLAGTGNPADMAEAVLQMDGLIARMLVLSEQCGKCVIIGSNNFLEKTQRQQDQAIRELEKYYQQEVSVYQGMLQSQVDYNACVAAVTQLEPILKTVSDLSGMKEFKDFDKNMKTVSHQLKAWGELQKGMDDFHKYFDAYITLKNSPLSLVEVEQVEKERKPAKGAPPPVAGDEVEDEEAQAKAQAQAKRAKELEDLMPKDRTRTAVGKQLGKALQMALDQDKGCLPDDFSEIIAEVEEWCADAELLPGGCPQPVVAKGGIKGALGLGSAAWRSAIPLSVTYVLPVLAAIVCPSF